MPTKSFMLVMVMACSACGMGPPNPFDKAAGMAGNYKGELETKPEGGTNTNTTQISLTIERSITNEEDAFFVAPSFPCPAIPLKKSGDTLELDGDFECESSSSSTVNGTTTENTNTSTITKLEVSLSGQTIDVEAEWENKTDVSTTVSKTEATFEGDRVAEE